MRTAPVLTAETLKRVAGGCSFIAFGSACAAIAWFVLWIQGSVPGFFGFLASILVAVGAFKARGALNDAVGEPEEETVVQRVREPVVTQRFDHTVADVPKAIVKEEPQQDSGPSWTESIDWEQWVGKKLLQKVGILIVLVGMVVLLKYSFDNRWIGELGRIALGVIGAGALFAAGEWYNRKYGNWAHAFTGAGLALSYFTVWVAHVFYAKQLLAIHGLSLPPMFALFLYALITAVGCIAAIRYRSQVIAWFAAAGGYLTPFLIEGPSRPLLLTAYLLILGSGLLALAWKQRWKYLNLAAFAVTQLYLFGVIYQHTSISDGHQIGIAILFFVLFNVLPLLYQFALREKAQSDDIVLLVANGLAVFLPVVEAMGGIASEYVGVVCLLLAAVYLAFGAAALKRCSDDATLVNTYLVGTVTLVALALLQEMRTPEYSYVAAGWAPLSALLAFISLRLRRSGPWYCALILLVGALFFLLLNLPGTGVFAEEVWYPFTSRFALQGYVVFASLIAWIVAARNMPAQLLPLDSRPKLLVALNAVLAVLVFMMVTFEATALDFTADLRLTFAYLLFAVAALTVFMLTGSRTWFVASVGAHILVLLFTFVFGHNSGMVPFDTIVVTPFVHSWAAIALCALLFTCCLFYGSQHGPDNGLKKTELRGVLVASALAQVWLHLTVEIAHMQSFNQWDDELMLRILSGWWILFAAALMVWGVAKHHKAFIYAGIVAMVIPFFKDIVLILDAASFYETVLWTVLPLVIAIAGSRAKSKELMVTGVAMLGATAACDMLAHIEAAKEIGFTRSVWWAIAAAASIAAGFVERQKLLRSAGIVIFGAVAFKLLVIDFSGLPTGIRIGASIAIGLLMIGASYLYQRSNVLASSKQ